MATSNNIMKIATTAMLISVLLQVSGCIPLYTAARTETPTFWIIDDTRLQNGCPVISGIYENIGETAPTSNDPYQAGYADIAGQFCLSNEGLCGNNPKYIKFSQDSQDGSVLIYESINYSKQETNTTIEPITLMGASQKPARLRSSEVDLHTSQQITVDPSTETNGLRIPLTIKKDFECSNNFIIFSQTKRSWGEMSDYTISTHTIKVSRLKSGDLFMQATHINSGVMLIFIARSVDEKKFRFKSIKKSD